MTRWIETWDAGYRELWQVITMPDGTLMPIAGPFRKVMP